jgi:hypothetical protein
VLALCLLQRLFCFTTYILHIYYKAVKGILQIFFRNFRGIGNWAWGMGHGALGICLPHPPHPPHPPHHLHSFSVRRCVFQNCSANATAGWMGALGLVFSTIPASCRRRSLLVELQRSHAVTTLSQVCCPPLERGITWSRVKRLLVPQYWQVWLSRLSTSRRFTGGTFQ